MLYFLAIFGSAGSWAEWGTSKIEAGATTLSLHDSSSEVLTLHKHYVFLVQFMWSSSGWYECLTSQCVISTRRSWTLPLSFHQHQPHQAHLSFAVALSGLTLCLSLTPWLHYYLSTLPKLPIFEKFAQPESMSSAVAVVKLQLLVVADTESTNKDSRVMWWIGSNQKQKWLFYTDFHLFPNAASSNPVETLWMLVTHKVKPWSSPWMTHVEVETWLNEEREKSLLSFPPRQRAPNAL